MRESEAVVSYLKSLSSGSAPSQQELETLARIAGWEEARQWYEKMEREDEVDDFASQAPPPPPARRKRPRQVYDPKTMTRAVARDLGLI